MTQVDTAPNGNTKKGIRARIWQIVINNYTEEHLTQWHKVLDKCEKYVWQYERGEKEETPHIQGHIVFKNAITFNSLKKQLPTAHIEKVRNIKASEEYCAKLETREGETFTKGFEAKISLKERLLNIEYSDVKWFDWQQDVIDILDGKVDKRKIYWYWEKNGNVGKSFLAKYICLKYNCIIATGKTGDIFNQLLSWRNDNPDELQLPPIIIDNPRSEFGHINYAAIEALKNGFIYSGKYEGGQVFGLSPHVIVFANSRPKSGELSEDRIVEYYIGDEDEDDDEDEE